MPFWGLVFTSCGFMIPAILANRRKKTVFAKACKVVSISSILYHSTLNTVIKKVDMCLAHSLACFGILKSWISTVRHPSRTKCIMTITPCIPIYLYTQKSAKTVGMESKMWHLAFHISGQCCLSLYALFF